jgi:hypothetical protein
MYISSGFHDPLETRIVPVANIFSWRFFDVGLISAGKQNSLEVSILRMFSRRCFFAGFSPKSHFRWKKILKNFFPVTVSHPSRVPPVSSLQCLQAPMEICNPCRQRMAVVVLLYAVMHVSSLIV